MRRVEAETRRAGPLGDVDEWMAWRWADLEGRNLGAGLPSEKVVEPGAMPDLDAPQAMDLGLRFEAARPGDSISRLIGSSAPGAVGKFLALNGMDGRDSTLKVGRSYVVPTQWDDATEGETRVGRALLGVDDARLRTAAERRAVQQRQTGLFREGRNVWTGQLPATASAPAARPSREPRAERSPLDDSPTAKAIAGGLGWGLGLVPGVGRGAFNTVKGAGEGVYFVYRLTDPYDALRSAPGGSAREQLVGAARGASDYAMRGIKDPSVVQADVASALHDFELKQNPFATPAADTLLEEYKRAFRVGMNNGELAFDTGSMLVGGEFMRGAAGIGRLAKAPTAKELAFFAKNPGFAARLELPYDGMSHHIIGRNADMPWWLGGGKYPEWLIESEFNKIRHEGISTRDLYRNHVGVDGDYTGGKVGKPYGSVRWNAEKDLGWTAYGPLDRVNYGTSPYTKAVVGPVLFGGTAVDSSKPEAGW